VRGCIQKFPDWPPGARTANGKALCHYVQLYRCFVSQSSEFCRHDSLCFFSTSVCCCTRIFRYRLSPETFGYTLVCCDTDVRMILPNVRTLSNTCCILYDGLLYLISGYFIFILSFICYLCAMVVLYQLTFIHT
jgi:hypothetical protein